LTAPLLLETIRGRGGKITVALDQTGAAKIQIAPRGIVGDLAGEIARFKPALLELLEMPVDAPKNASGRAQTGETPQSDTDDLNAAQIALNATDWPDIPQNRNYYGKTNEFRALATAILDARRPDGGFDFGAVKPHWKRANKITGVSMDAPTLANWARALLGKEEN
jgi:hypothetical protein